MDTVDKQRRHLMGIGAAAAALAALPPAVRAGGDWPARPITFISPWAVGGTGDMLARPLCTAAGRHLGQTIVYTNRPGASGMIGCKAVATAAPDGYTVGEIPITVGRLALLGMTDIKPLEDYAYIARTSGQNLGLAVMAGSPWQSLPALLEDAARRPGQITFGFSGLGGSNHIAVERVLRAAGVQLTAIPFKGGNEALQALYGGHLDMLADSSSWAPGVKAGKLRLLATMGEQRSKMFADTPTLKDLGYDVADDGPRAVAAPAGTPEPIVRKLREAFRVAVASREFTEACAQIDAPPMYLDGPDFRQYLVDTMAQERKLIEQLDMKTLLQVS